MGLMLITRKEDLESLNLSIWKKYEALPPFHCTVEFAKSIKDIEPQKNQEYVGLKEFGEYVSKITNQDINKYLRLVEVEEDIMPLVINTDNKIFYRNLFFPSVFLNNEIKFEHVLVKGILICDINTKEDYNITALCLDLRDKGFYTAIFSLIKHDEDRSSLKSKDDIKFSTRLNDYLRSIVCNFVDLVEGNDEDIDVVEIITTREQKLKRIKRGKIPFPTKIFIKAKKEFKKYVQEFNKKLEDSEKKGFGYKFLVMGHFMHFRSDRYIHAKGTKKWVKPFMKGEGILISKDYKVIQE